jgi:hypothetical protein
MSDISKIKINITIQPWFNELVNNLKEALEKTIGKGMPINMAEDLMIDTLRTVISRAVVMDKFKAEKEAIKLRTPEEQRKIENKWCVMCKDFYTLNQDEPCNSCNHENKEYWRLK